MKFSSRALIIAALVVALAAAGTFAQSQNNALQQTRTAIQHAGFSTNSDEHSSAVLHLGHVLNCLEGPYGDHFNPKWGNPCRGLGTGAIPDAGDHQAAQWLVAARDLSLLGIDAPELNTAHLIAHGVRLLLEEAAVLFREPTN